MSDTFIGNKGVYTTLQNQFKNGAVHHANLIIGPKQVGKSTLVNRLILEAFQDKPAGIEAKKHAQLLEKGMHPNVHSLQPNDNGTHTIEAARELIRSLSITATLNTWRFVIVENAGNMSASTANALLKVLEEPPKQTVWWLLTSQIDKILPTIQSRCAQFWMNPVSNAELLKEWPQLDGMVQLAKGLPGRAAQLSTADVRGDMSATILPWVQACLAANVTERQNTTSALLTKTTTRADIISYIDRVISVLRDALLIHEGMGQAMIYRLYTEEISQISRKHSVPVLLQMIESLQNLREKLAQPLQPKLAFKQLLIILSPQ